MYIKVRRQSSLACLLALAVWSPAQVAAQSAVASTDEQAIHEDLRALRDGMLGAWQQRDVDALLSFVSEDVVVTWQNGTVNRGHEGVREFYDQMLGGDDAVIADMISTLDMQELAILHGADAAVAYGTLHDEVTFSRTLASASFIGADTQISLDSYWTAALSRINGQWQLTAFHVSVDMFSNPVLSMATSATRWIMGAFGMIFGLIVSFVVMRVVGAGRRRAEA